MNEEAGGGSDAICSISQGSDREDITSHSRHSIISRRRLWRHPTKDDVKDFR